MVVREARLLPSARAAPVARKPAAESAKCNLVNNDVQRNVQVREQVGLFDRGSNSDVDMAGIRDPYGYPGFESHSLR